LESELKLFDLLAKAMGTLEACSILLFREVISSRNLGQASHVPISLDLGVFGTLILGDSLVGMAHLLEMHAQILTNFYFLEFLKSQKSS